ncbi:MAG: DNA repair exonuclease [Beijerinckiaceae bacterium]|nr:MAG: DNA repair exonuclease [Beijerinckiaceae bacterium]
MVNFRFIHAADLHLDSPLIGLAKKSEDCAARRDDASRRAFDNLVGLAIEEDCRLIVVAIDELGAVIHGRSYPQRDVVDNIAIEYPSPVPVRFNIGLLRTACGGSEGHLPYAPCAVAQLVNHGYQYWALGHIHKRQELAKAPYIVYPGNLQGRSVRETGPKGATFVEVVDGGVSRIEHRALDVVRWTVEDVNLTGMETREALLPAVRESVERAYAGCDGRALAMRLRVVGSTFLHAELAATAASVREEIETLAAGIASDIWIEKVEIRTSPSAASADVDPTVAGRLRQAVQSLAADPWLTLHLEALLAEINKKLPAGARRDEIFQVLRDEGPEKARTLALAMIDLGQG